MKLKEILTEPVYFITGIDTDCGKTYCTAYLSKTLLSEGVNCITQKLIQTGCTGVSEDIESHRRLEGRPLTEDDLSGLTCPLVYTYPCSPHMAIAIDGRKNEIDKSVHSTEELKKKYDTVLVEGAGGLMVPLTEEYHTRDYIAEQNIPVILVSTAKLGSINHTLLSLEVLQHSNIRVAAVLYNEGVATDEKITAETRHYLEKWLKKNMLTTTFIPVPKY